MGAEEIRAFLSCLNNERQIAGSTYSQVLCALPSCTGKPCRSIYGDSIYPHRKVWARTVLIGA